MNDNLMVMVTAILIDTLLNCWFCPAAPSVRNNNITNIVDTFSKILGMT